MNDLSGNQQSTKLSKQLEIFIYRAPKENHNAMIRVNEQSRDFFMKHGVSNFEVFLLGSKDDIMDFANVSKAILAGDGDEVWLEIQSYRDIEHVKEFMKAMEGDKSIEPLYKDFMELITPGSIVSFGSFNKLDHVSM